MLIVFKYNADPIMIMAEKETWPLLRKRANKSQYFCIIQTDKMFPDC